MRPEKNSNMVKIPLTFDFKSKGFTDTSGKSLWILLISIFWMISSLIIIFISPILVKILYPVTSFLFFLSIIRFVILREFYFRKKRKELLDNNNIFKHSVFWNICDISDTYPYVCQLANNKKCIYVSFEKSVVVGQGEDGIFYHHEALAEAYNELTKKNISFMHIDYMDSVGKDNRMYNIFSETDKIKNPEIKELLTVIFDNMQYEMKKHYSSYDVFCFYFKGRDDLFWDDLSPILNMMLRANYKKYTILDKGNLQELVKVVMNLDEFSITNASDEIFKSLKETNFITIIWVESNGVRTRVNKTFEELEEIKRTSMEEYKTQKILNSKIKHKNKLKRLQKIILFFNKILKKQITVKNIDENNEEISLFEDDKNYLDEISREKKIIGKEDESITIEVEDDDILIEEDDDK